MEDIPSHFESDCDKCGGEGGRHHIDKTWLNCPDCHGTGKRPTQEGMQLLRFLERHLPDFNVEAF